MSRELILTSPIPPSVNHYLGRRTIMKNGKPVSISYTTREADNYKKDFVAYVKREAEAQHWDLEPNDTQHFYVDAVFYFDRGRMDPNNYFKLLLDGITDSKCVWLDDDVTCERVQAIYYDTANPRIDIVIHPTDYIGVFPDADRLKTFETRCFDCKRYKRNCSILKNAKHGKIQPEVEACRCTAFSPIKKG